MTSLLFRNVEVDGHVGDVQVDDGRIAAVAATLHRPPGVEVVEGRGGALIPGLWDHHIHLVALAAARRSIPVGPPDVSGLPQLTDALRRRAATHPGGWVRAVGYHESVAGELDRHRLDELVADVPVRVQHRSGAMWILNSAALRRLDPGTEPPPGLERDEHGEPTGRLLGGDRWLGDQLRTIDEPPDLAAVGAELAGYGVVGVTDATPYERPDDLHLLASATRTGSIPQHVVAMGGPALTDHTFPASLGRGPVKLLLADHALPSLDELVQWIEAAHVAGRPIAAHCVTRSSLVLMLVALDEAGAAPGDRIEHGSVVPPELRDPLLGHGLTIVTQPNFVSERGDRYLVEVEPDDRPHLYPCRSLVDAGIAVAGSTDAPFGHPDPWRSIAAAITRRTTQGQVLDATERLRPPAALGLFLGSARAPGSGTRRIERGARADLCLLHEPMAALGAGTDAAIVRMTTISGGVVHRSDRSRGAT